MFSVHHAALGWTNRMKSIAIILFALLLFTASGCTNVYVSVHNQATSGSGLTGLNCKLQRELKNQHQETNVWCWAASAHTVIEYLRNEEIQQRDILQAVFRSQLAYEWAEKLAAANEKLAAASSPEEKKRLQSLLQSLQSMEHPNCSTMPMPEEYLGPIEENIRTAQHVCYQPGYPDWVFATEQFHAAYDLIAYDWIIPYPNGLNWDEIVEEICSDRPMISLILYGSETSAGSHAVVIGGYSELVDGSRWVHVYDPGANTEEEETYIVPYDVHLGDPGVFIHARDYTNISAR